jgi:hypothetical protein
LICPLCKNEKWNNDICPNCGLGEKEALLARANELKKREMYLEAGDLFQKFLQLEPGQKSALRMLAVCLSIETISRRDVVLYERARAALTQALDSDWLWDQGHQFQIDLSICFQKQADLINDYEKMSLNNEARKSVSERMIKVIRLTEKFKDNPPVVSTNLTSDFGGMSFFKKYWIVLLGLPILLFAIYEVPNIFYGNKEKISFLAPFIFLTLGAGILVLILMGLNIYRKNKESVMGKNIDQKN